MFCEINKFTTGKPEIQVKLLIAAKDLFNQA